MLGYGLCPWHLLWRLLATFVREWNVIRCVTYFNCKRKHSILVHYWWKLYVLKERWTSEQWLYVGCEITSECIWWRKHISHGCNHMHFYRWPRWHSIKGTWNVVYCQHQLNMTTSCRTWLFMLKPGVSEQKAWLQQLSITNCKSCGT
jgi:hypothetical protein